MIEHTDSNDPSATQESGGSDYRRLLAEQVAEKYNDILRDNTGRACLLGRDVAHHPKTIRRVLEELDSTGPTEAGDVIHSLVWRLVLEERRAARFADELMSRSTF